MIRVREKDRDDLMDGDRIQSKGRIVKDRAKSGEKDVGIGEAGRVKTASRVGERR